MNNQIKQHILENYSKYGILNEKNKPITKYEMLALLNILEANQETLESFHDAAFNGYNEFCGLFGPFENDTHTYNALISHFWFVNEDQFIDYMLDQIEDYTADGSTDAADYFKRFVDDTIYKTSDGYVIRFDY